MLTKAEDPRPTITFSLKPRLNFQPPFSREKSHYRQHCPLSFTLDIIGESWTLLILRELLHGPRGYRALLAGLPGIGPTLLTKRLKALERAQLLNRNLLERRSPEEPYSLTAKGRALEPVLISMAAWGQPYLPQPTGEEVYSPAWTLLGMKARYTPIHARDQTTQFEFRIDDEVFFAHFGGPTLRTGYGPADSPDVIIQSDAETFLFVFEGRMSLREALQMRKICIEGSLTVLASGMESLGLMREPPALTTDAARELIQEPETAY